MRIIGIDPGPTESGYVFLVDGAVADSATLPNDQLRELVERECRFGVGAVGIEQVRSYGMAVGAEVFDTCVETGRYVEAAARAGVKATLIPRMDVKMNLCHSPRAKDSNIRQALIDRMGSDRKGGPLYGVKRHAWAALAVAVTLADRLAMEVAA